MRGVEPRWFSCFVAVVALFYAARPTNPVASRDPSARPRRRNQPVRAPRVRDFWMLHHAAEATNGCECSRETSSVVAEFTTARERVGSTASIAAPSLARRVRDNGVRSVVQTRIALLVPRINVVEAEVRSVALDVERRDHASTTATV